MTTRTMVGGAPGKHYEKQRLVSTTSRHVCVLGRVWSIGA